MEFVPSCNVTPLPANVMRHYAAHLLCVQWSNKAYGFRSRELEFSESTFRIPDSCRQVGFIRGNTGYGDYWLGLKPFSCASHRFFCRLPALALA